MQELNSKITSKPLYQAFELMHDLKLDEAEKILESGLKEAEASGDKVLTALFYSAYGVLYKLRKEFRKSWKFYEKAEKLIPQDPSLKIISSRLLVEYFGQYDTVIKKMDKVLQNAGETVAYAYQAYTLQGLAYLRKGNKKKAVECLKQSMQDGFKGLETAANFDFKLVAELIKKKIEPALCREYIEKAREFCQKTHEKIHEKMFEKLLSLFPA